MRSFVHRSPFRQWQPRLSRLVGLFGVLVLLATACSNSGDSASDNTENTPTTAADSSNSDESDDVSSTTIPEVIAFVEDPLTLRVGLPVLEFAAPHVVDEVDSVAVLVTDALTDGLTTIDTDTGLVGPAIAESWSVSNDELTWTFALGDHSFSSGDPITADDVVASLNRVAARGVLSLNGPSLWAVDGWIEASPPDTVSDIGETDAAVSVPGLRAVSTSEVEITLTTPFAALPEVLAGVVFGVLPADDDQIAQDDGSLPISSSVDFEPVALWEDGIRLQGEQAAGVVSTIELFLDPEASMLAAGEVDLGVGYDPELSLPGIEQTQSERSAHVFFAMDATEAPFDDPQIRQAVLHTLDRNELRDEFFPGLAVMDGFVASSGSAPVEAGSRPVDACGGACDIDLEQARLLVDASANGDVAFTVDYFLVGTDSGPADSADGEENTDGEDSGDVSPEEQLANQIAASLREIGLDATAVGHDPAEYGMLAANGELGLFRFGSVTTSPSREADVAAMFSTGGADNITGTSIDRLDDLFIEARSELDSADRQVVFAEAESVLFGEAVIAPLVTLQHQLWFGETLSRAGLEPDGSLDLSAMGFVLDEFAADE